MTSKINGSDNFDTDPLSKLDWDGIPYVDPDAIGANATAKIYPDGSIVGSTDNGSYTKWPNGDLICSGRVYVNLIIDKPHGALFFRNLPTINYPILYAYENTPTISRDSGSGGIAWVAVTNSSTSSLVSVAVSTETGIVMTYVTWASTGRWK